jgi:hypothetical protein
VRFRTPLPFGSPFSRKENGEEASPADGVLHQFTGVTVRLSQHPRSKLRLNFGIRNKKDVTVPVPTDRTLSKTLGHSLQAIQQRRVRLSFARDSAEAKFSTEIASLLVRCLLLRLVRRRSHDDRPSLCHKASTRCANSATNPTLGQHSSLTTLRTD